MFLAGVVVGSVITFSLITLYSCLVVAGRVDRQMEKVLEDDELGSDK